MCLNQGTANYVNTAYFIHQGNYSNQSHGVCFTLNDKRTQDCNCLLIFVLPACNNLYQMYIFKLTFTLLKALPVNVRILRA